MKFIILSWVDGGGGNIFVLPILIWVRWLVGGGAHTLQNGNSYPRLNVKLSA